MKETRYKGTQNSIHVKCPVSATHTESAGQGGTLLSQFSGGSGRRIPNSKSIWATRTDPVSIRKKKRKERRVREGCVSVGGRREEWFNVRSREQKWN